MRISDSSSDVCSSDLLRTPQVEALTSRPGADPIAPVPRRMQILHTGDQRQIGLNEQRILGIKREVLRLVDQRLGEIAFHGTGKVLELLGVHRAVVKVRADDPPVAETAKVGVVHEAHTAAITSADANKLIKK